jgi:hypothetical protein
VGRRVAACESRRGHQARVTPLARPFRPDDVVIATARDAALDFGWQVKTAKDHRLEVVELDAGHSRFITQPLEFAGLLASLA